MPTLDYTRTPIVFYKIKCKDAEINSCYVGSTSNIQARAMTHRTHSKTRNCKVYRVINSNGGIDNWFIEVIETRICGTKQDALRLEQDYINKFGLDMNKARAFISQEERSIYSKIYYQTHKEDYAQKRKDYYKNHREEILQKQRLYQSQNREKLNENQRKNWYKYKTKQNESRKRRYYEKKALLKNKQ